MTSTPYFFQSQWDRVGNFVCGGSIFFEGNNVDSDFNNTLIFLIPKVQNLESFL